MKKLELVHRIDNSNFYWYLDEYGYYLNSIDYETIDEAIIALIENEIEWKVKVINK